MCVPKGMGICPGGGCGWWATLEVARRERHMSVMRLVDGIVADVLVSSECRGEIWRKRWTADNVDK